MIYPAKEEKEEGAGGGDDDEGAAAASSAPSGARVGRAADAGESEDEAIGDGGEGDALERLLQLQREFAEGKEEAEGEEAAGEAPPLADAADAP
jgi:hypothetical protein